MNEVQFPTITIEWMGQKSECLHLIALDNSNSWITDQELDDYFQTKEKSIQVVYSYILETGQALIAFEKYETFVSDMLKSHVENFNAIGPSKWIIVESFCVDLDEVFLMMSPIAKNILNIFKTGLIDFVILN